MGAGSITGMADVTVRVEQPFMDYRDGEVVTIERTPFVDRLIEGRRVTVIDETVPPHDPPPNTVWDDVADDVALKAAMEEARTELGALNEELSQNAQTFATEAVESEAKPTYPAASAPKQDWIDFATHIGINVDGLTKTEIITEVDHRLG